MKGNPEEGSNYIKEVEQKPIVDYNTEVQRGRQQVADTQAADKSAADIARTEAETANQNSEAQARATPAVKEPASDFELWARQNPTAPAGDWLKLQESAKPAPAAKEPSQDDRNAKEWIDAHPKEFQPDAQGNKYIASNMVKARVAFKGAEAAAGRDPQAAADRTAAAADRHQKVENDAQAARDKAVHPYQSKVDSAETAKDYLASGAFTGSSDEALMLQFFNATKPETGFRLTKTEQKMLENARSWFGSWEAKYLHETKGTYFSEDQRKQIVDTMTQMASRAQQNIEDYDGKHKGSGPSAQGAANPQGSAKVIKYDAQGNPQK